jgi:adenylate cyclase
MVQNTFKRRLSANLSANIAGYSRLIRDDREATVPTLATYRKALTHLILQHRGWVADSPGDNVLAGFTSVVDEARCAVETEKGLQARTTGLHENRRTQFRFGMNLGDVIKEQPRIYGDIVNIAAPLESLADPGRICVSKIAFDHFESKLPLGYEYLVVKNAPQSDDITAIALYRQQNAYQLNKISFLDSSIYKDSIFII